MNRAAYKEGLQEVLFKQAGLADLLKPLRRYLPGYAAKVQEALALRDLAKLTRMPKGVGDVKERLRAALRLLR